MDVRLLFQSQAWMAFVTDQGLQEGPNMKSILLQGEQTYRPLGVCSVGSDHFNFLDSLHYLKGHWNAKAFDMNAGGNQFESWLGIRPSFRK
jgi:hypothetical protein